MLKASCFPLPLFRERKTLNITASILDLEKETDRSKCLSFFKFFQMKPTTLFSPVPIRQKIKKTFGLSIYVLVFVYLSLLPVKFPFTV